MMRSKVEQDLSCDGWCTKKLFFSDFGPSTDIFAMPKLFYLSVVRNAPCHPKSRRHLIRAAPGTLYGRHPTIAAGEIICPEFWVVTGWARQGFYALKQFLLWQVRSYHLAWTDHPLLYERLQQARRVPTASRVMPEQSKTKL